MRSVLAFALCAVVLVSLFACSSSAANKSAGTQCTSDSECSSGLFCLGVGTMTDAGCTTLAKSCSMPCSASVDCSTLGPKFACLTACDGMHACGATL